VGLCKSNGGHINARVHQKEIARIHHILPGQFQNCPYAPKPKQYGTQAQAPLKQDNRPTLVAKGINVYSK
jgi:hypothetical protein